LYKIQYGIANYTNYENLFYNPFSILVLKTDLILLKSSPKGEGVNPIPANYIKVFENPAFQNFSNLIRFLCTSFDLDKSRIENIFKSIAYIEFDIFMDKEATNSFIETVEEQICYHTSTFQELAIKSLGKHSANFYTNKELRTLYFEMISFLDDFSPQKELFKKRVFDIYENESLKECYKATRDQLKNLIVEASLAYNFTDCSLRLHFLGSCNTGPFSLFISKH
jgi:hypothetical protein